MFVPLHVHSQYSILDASASVCGIAEKAAEFGMPAVALTDHGNMFGAIDFYKACTEAGVKPIIGCEVYVAPGSRLEKKRERGVRTSFHLVLLAKNDVGYHNLCKLVSIGYLEGFYYHPRIDHEVLEKYHEGLVCLSGCLSNRAAYEILNGSQALEVVKWYKKLFGEDYYLELQRHPMTEEDIQNDGIYQESWLLQQYQNYIANQEKVNQTLLEIARKEKIKVVATNDSHYLHRSDWKAHEILLNIQSGEPCEIWERDSQGNPKFRIPNPKRRIYSSHEFYFKSPEQMDSLFHDVPEAVSNTQEVADKCNLEIDFKTKHYPVYVPPSLEGKKYSKKERIKEAEKFLKNLCNEGIVKRFTPDRLAKVKEIYPDRDPMDVVRERLELELEIIVTKDMCDYLLIVWDFINWAKKQGIPVGPGRGSGAGSIILYLIEVTDVEPLRFNLFFERFINPERISYPDIDVDICMDRREEVIQYTMQKYGKDNVAQIITFGTMKAKMVIRDVGRVLSVPLSKVNNIAKLVPEELDITLDKALEKDPEFRKMYDQDEDAKRIIDIGQKLEGSIRNTGIHAAGIIVSEESLTNMIPICNAKDTDIAVTQYSMKPVEQVGMLKIDFLGLKTLTAIQMCVDAIDKEIDWVNLPLDDAPTFDLLNRGKTLGVFQLESTGMQDLARQLHLDKFEEIIAVGALYRPGPMDMIPSFINRKHGREPIEYDHPWIEDILAETYGIMVYQEQVMQIASKLGKYSLGEGDVLRRAMGKKQKQEMAKQREKFKKGALENGIDEAIATNIFDKMEKFASYGFNKSHATAYGYLSYVTAYLKANYPKEWMAALMTCDSADISKVAKFIRECHSMDIAILPPDVNEAGHSFVATSQGIRFAISAIKGVGTGVVAAIVQECERNGPFTNLYQFFKRINASKVGKKIVESLVNAGCFDFTEWSRDALRQSVEPMFESAHKEQKEEAMGVMSLFSLMGDTAEKYFTTPPEVKIKTPDREIYLREKELLGFFLTGHPMDEYMDVLKRLSCIPIRKMHSLEDGAVFRSAFLVESVKVRISSKTQRKFAILMISDGMESQELPIWSDLFEEKHHLIRENQLLYAVLKFEKKDGTIRLNCRWLDDLTQVNEQMIEACDRAYDRAKQQVTRFASTKKQQVKKTAMNITEKLLCLKLDANNTRLSHILQMKKIFEEHRGDTPIQIDFQSDKQEFAILHINSRWGISITPKLQERLKNLGPVISITKR